jgi:hypothetical protein
MSSATGGIRFLLRITMTQGGGLDFSARISRAARAIWGLAARIMSVLLDASAFVVRIMTIALGVAQFAAAIITFVLRITRFAARIITVVREVTRYAARIRTVILRPKAVFQAMDPTKPAERRPPGREERQEKMKISEESSLGVPGVPGGFSIGRLKARESALANLFRPCAYQPHGKRP